MTLELAPAPPKVPAFDLLFEAVAEAAEEAALNALFQTDTVVGRDGHVLFGLPIDRVLGLVHGWRPGVSTAP